MTNDALWKGVAVHKQSHKQLSHNLQFPSALRSVLSDQPFDFLTQNLFDSLSTPLKNASSHSSSEKALKTHHYTTCQAPSCR